MTSDTQDTRSVAPFTGAAVSLRNVWKYYGPVAVLKDVSLDFQPGEVHALLGENGAGKSTLTKIISGEIRPSQGDVEIRGVPVHLRGPSDAMRHGVACVYQDLTLLDNLSVADNLLLGREPAAGRLLVHLREMRRRATEQLASVGNPVRPTGDISKLGVGGQALLEVAKWWPRADSVLILDEPTSALTDEHIRILFSLIEELKSRQIALIYITHRLDEVRQIADVASVLQDGRLVGQLGKSELNEERIVRLMTGTVRSERRSVTGPVRPLANHSALEAVGLGGARFSNVTFTVAPGEIVGLAGEADTGVEDLAETLSGWRRPRGGQVLIAQRRCWTGDPRAVRRMGLAFLPGDRKVDGLALNRTVAENITAGALRKSRRWGMISRKRDTQIAAEAAARAMLSPTLLGRRVARMSGGQQQKVLLAQCLAAEPRVLVAVEPTRGVDVAAREEIHQVLRSVCENSGVAVVVVSSDSRELEELCTRVLVFSSGRPVTELVGPELDRTNILLAMHAGAEGATSPPDSPVEGGAAKLANPASQARRVSPDSSVSGQAAAGGERQQGLGQLVARTYRRAAWAPSGFGLALMVLILSLTSKFFLTAGNFENLGRQVVVLALASLGEMLVILMAGIDLSIGSVVTLANLMSTALLLKDPIPAAVLATLAMGLASGLLCGLLVVRGLPSFLVTYAIGLIEAGLALLWFPHSIGPVPRSFWLLSSAQVGPIPAATLVLTLLAGLIFLVIRYGRVGRHLLAVGRDPLSARRTGLPHLRLIVAAYSLSGLLAAAAGTFLTARVGGGLPGSGTDVLLDAIAAVMLGGASFFGGRVSVLGTFVGVCVLTLIGNGLDLLHVNPFLNGVVLGGVVLLVVGGASLSRRPGLGERVT